MDTAHSINETLPRGNLQSIASEEHMDEARIRDIPLTESGDVLSEKYDESTTYHQDAYNQTYNEEEIRDSLVSYVSPASMRQANSGEIYSADRQVHPASSVLTSVLEDAQDNLTQAESQTETMPATSGATETINSDVPRESIGEAYTIVHPDYATGFQLKRWNMIPPLNSQSRGASWSNTLDHHAEDQLEPTLPVVLVPDSAGSFADNARKAVDPLLPPTQTDTPTAYKAADTSERLSPAPDLIDMTDAPTDAPCMEDPPVEDTLTAVTSTPTGHTSNKSSESGGMVDTADFASSDNLASVTHSLAHPEFSFKSAEPRRYHASSSDDSADEMCPVLPSLTKVHEYATDSTHPHTVPSSANDPCTEITNTESSACSAYLNDTDNIGQQSNVPADAVWLPAPSTECSAETNPENPSVTTNCDISSVAISSGFEAPACPALVSVNVGSADYCDEISSKPCFLPEYKENGGGASSKTEITAHMSDSSSDALETVTEPFSCSTTASTTNATEATHNSVSDSAIDDVPSYSDLSLYPCAERSSRDDANPPANISERADPSSNVRATDLVPQTPVFDTSTDMIDSADSSAASPSVAAQEAFGNELHRPITSGDASDVEMDTALAIYDPDNSTERIQDKILVDNYTEIPLHEQDLRQVDNSLTIDQGYQVSLPSSPRPASSPLLTSSPLPSGFSPLPSSSPIRSSSPPMVFSSSPPAELNSSPPSSPPPAWSDHGNQASGLESAYGATLMTEKKRAHIGDESPDIDDDPAKRLKTDFTLSPHRPPNPKRPTQASQRKQRKKLAAPFRSPIVDPALVRQGVDAVYASGKIVPEPKTKSTKRESPSQPSASSATTKVNKTTADTIKKDHTDNAAKQFKSPLSVDSGDSSRRVAFSSVQATPTIRTLQGKVQALKQAIRIRNAGGGKEEEELEALVEKWTTVGREVAWAVWDTVKDLDTSESINIGIGKGGWLESEFGRDSKEGWGYDDGEKKAGCSSRGWDEDQKMDTEDQNEKEQPDDEDGEPTVRHTLGTMLRHMGIAPETLGWNEDEGDFVDDD
ncbi:hypothetical protein WOLCODRAFT_163038 [Wolfiporia cocos MD-104 SS10]|uniref:Uncharacterized protein n=1 Tax=Wolfiporia cocos (strain MD-104) TaxID=742152 RepID=A0A2H3JZ02_WOLCO|nr:hypothetical protein WOLCODRAFT_163038 [Wolfiporia cocos MD-104 SS10]